MVVWVKYLRSLKVGIMFSVFNQHYHPVIPKSSPTPDNKKLNHAIFTMYRYTCFLNIKLYYLYNLFPQRIVIKEQVIGHKTADSYRIQI